MKKSRIIIPALAVMALSMGAAVTSTVAWFTANRNASATSGQISLINPEGALSITAIGQGSGSVAGDPATGNAVNVTHSGKLRDASVDLISGPDTAVYTSNLDSSGLQLANPKFRSVDKGPDGSYKDSGAICAFDYTITFSYGNASSETATYGLFLDTSLEGVIDGIVGEGTDSKAISMNKGLRIGLTATDSSGATHTLVYAPSRHRKLSTGDSYVSGTNATANYLETNLAAENKRITEFNTELKTEKNYLGMLTNNAPSGSLEVHVYVWFEGLDATIVNPTAGNEYVLPSDLSFKLDFNAVKWTYVAPL